MKIITSRSNFDKTTKAFQRRVRVMIYKQAEKVRDIARASMKTSPKGESSQPGTPPRSHLKTDKSGNIRKTKKGNNFKTFKDFILHSKEKTPDNYARAFIGPATRRWAEEIGHTHEFGGISVKKVKTKKRQKGSGKKRDSSGRFVKGAKKSGVTVITKTVSRRYPKRPFMQPAMSKASDSFPHTAGRVGGE